MADYPISPVNRRKVYSGSAGVGPYAFTFEILAATDISVWKNGVKLTLTTDYTVTINSNGTGSVTLLVAATGSDTIVVAGARSYQRSTDFAAAGDLTAAALNLDLDSLVVFVQQLAEQLGRTVRAPIYDPEITDYGGTMSMELPALASRANKFIAFDATGSIMLASATLPTATPVSATGASLVSAASAAAARGVLGSGVTGDALFLAANAAAARSTLGLGTLALSNTVLGSLAPLSTVTATEITANTITLAKLARVGTTGQVLTSQGAGADPIYATPAALTRATAVATTSGTAVDFTGIPAGVKRIMVAINGVSTNGTDKLCVRIGGGSIESTGYDACATIGGTGVVTQTDTTAFILEAGGGGGAAALRYINAILTNVSGNIWVASHSGAYNTTGAAFIAGGGGKTVGATLDRVRFTTLLGTDTFDAGSVTIFYES